MVTAVEFLLWIFPDTTLSHRLGEAFLWKCISEWADKGDRVFAQ